MSNTTLKKTIQVNPELFKMGGKTRKANKGEKVVVPKPLINPNTVKLNLLKRLDQRKKMEIKSGGTLGIKPKPYILSESEDLLNENNNNENKEDEFFNALSYLTDFKKKQQVDSEKKRYEEKKRQEALNRTIKNQSVSLGLSPNVNIPINLELAPELVADSNTPIMPLHKYKVDTETPGCLKGGIKPTYKALLKQTRKNVVETNIPNVLSTNNNINTNNNNNNNNNNNLIRQQKLALIKAKISSLEAENKALKEASTPKIIPDPNVIFTSINLDDNIINEKSDVAKAIESVKEKENELKQNADKKYSKKTIKRKFTLGKSNIYRKVGILVGNKQSRKNVIEAQKELKRTPMSDIKRYLKHHGLIKVGSTATNDVLRKMYESAIMAGEITNINKDTLIHNFINDDTNK